jgi:hypothetical protein
VKPISRKLLARGAVALAVTLGSAMALQAAYQGTAPEPPAKLQKQAGRDAPAARPAWRDAALLELDLARMKKVPVEDEVEDAFAERSWQPPPPPAVKAEPVVPPLPFSYLGRMVDGDQVVLFLARQGQSREARAGDTLDRVWRIDEIGERAVKFTFLPLEKQRVLTLEPAPP